MDVFKIIVTTIVALVIIALIYTLFISPKPAPEEEIANKLLLAYNNPGTFASGEVTLEQTLNYYQIKDHLPSQIEIVYNYYSLISDLNVITLALVPSVDLYKKLSLKPQKKKDYKFSTICYPSFFGQVEGGNGDMYCLIVFGLEKNDFKDPNVNFSMKKTVYDYNLYEDYSLDAKDFFYADVKKDLFFLANDSPEYNEKFDVGNLYNNKDFFTGVDLNTSGKTNVSFSFKDVGDYYALLYYTCPEVIQNLWQIRDNIIIDFPLCNLYMEDLVMKVKSDYGSLSKSCVATVPLNENEYNFEEGVCIKKFGCNNCLAPAMCADIWNKTDGKEYLSYKQDVALTNEPMSYDDCVGGTSANTDSSTATTQNQGIDYSFLNKVKNYGGKRKGYNFFVIHDGGTWGNSSSEQAAASVINMWNNGNASTHYYITCEGKTFEFLNPANVAWHGGCADGFIKNVNAYSIGIDLRNCEKVTSGHYTSEQMQSLSKLLTSLSAQYGILLSDKSVIGHFEVGCHDDPYTDFSWTSLPGITVNHRVSSYYYNKESQEASAWVVQMFS